MTRKNESPQKAAMRERMRSYLKDNDISIKDGTDVNAIMRDMMSVLLEGALDKEFEQELGYSKYDYQNKDTAGTDIPKRLCIPDMGIWMWQSPVTVMVNMSCGSLRSDKIL